MVGDLFSVFVLTRTISEDSFAKYPVSDPSQRLSSQGQSLRDPSPPGRVSPAYQIGSPKDPGTKILAPGTWYQDLGTKIFGTKILGEEGIIFFWGGASRVHQDFTKKQDTIFSCVSCQLKTWSNIIPRRARMFLVTTRILLIKTLTIFRACGISTLGILLLGIILNSRFEYLPEFWTQPAAPPDEPPDPNLAPLPTHLGIKYFP